MNLLQGPNPLCLQRHDHPPMIPERAPLQAHLSLDIQPPFRLTFHWTRLEVTMGSVIVVPSAGGFYVRISILTRVHDGYRRLRLGDAAAGRRASLCSCYTTRGDTSCSRRSCASLRARGRRRRSCAGPCAPFRRCATVSRAAGPMPATQAPRRRGLARGRRHRAYVETRCVSNIVPGGVDRGRLSRRARIGICRCLPR